MNTLINFVTRRPRLVIFLNLLVIGILALPLYKIKIDPDLRALIPKNDPDLKRMEALEEEYGGLDVIFISYHTDNVFSRQALELITELTQSIEALPYIDHTITLSNYESILSDEESMVVESFVSQLPQSDMQSDSLALLAERDPMLSQILISKDFEYTALIVFQDSDQEETLTVEALRALLMPYQNQGHDLTLGGMPVIRTQISEDISTDTVVFIPAGIILIAILLYFSFRSRRGTALPLIVVFLSILGTLGLMAWLELMISVISSIMPIMLIAVASAYGIHIITRYFEVCNTLPEETSNSEIIAQVIRHMMSPVFLAAITTIIGFLSLLSHVLPASRQLGLLTAFGVFLAFIISITLIPSTLVLLHKPARIRQERNQTNRFLSRVLAGLGKIVFQRKVAVISIFILLLVLAGIGIPKIILDSNPLNYYPEKSEVRVVNSIIDEHFGGSTTMSIIVEGDIKSPPILHQIERIQQYLSKMEGIGYSLAVTDFLKLMNQSMHDGDPEFYRIPETRQLVSQYLLLYSWESSDGYLDSYVDYNYEEAHISVRLNTMDVYRMVDIVKELNDFLDENIHVENKPKSEGYAVLLGNLMPMMVKGQIRSLFLSVILAALVTGILFRSFSAALISALPLAGAIIGVFGLMGYAGIKVNTATSMLSSIMIGIGIDYTLHFLYRFRAEIKAGLSDEQAIIKSLSTTGQGIIINGFSVIVGFSVSMLSTFIPIFYFGWLIAMSIFMCVLAALTLLPVVLVLTRPKFIYS